LFVTGVVLLSTSLAASPVSAITPALLIPGCAKFRRRFDNDQHHL
jgi:hypothetical protein